MSADDGHAAKVIPLKGARCPICNKSASAEMRPFCSKRCADLDLGRWLGGVYRVPTDEAPDDQASAAAAGDPGDDEER